MQVGPEYRFPKRHDGRSFHHHYLYRTLVNGENSKRSWLTYSKTNNAVYCFCCKLFSKKSFKLITEGQCDWVNIGILLKQHENSPDLMKNLVAWKELELHLQKGKTIDQAEISLMEAEKKRWLDILTHSVLSREKPGGVC